MKLPKLVLASASPRRAEILNAIGWEFKKASADVDEAERIGEDPASYVSRLAGEKARTIARSHPGELVLGADTTVVVDGTIIGKPVDAPDAKRMLGLLSGRWHEVLTGVALVRRAVPDTEAGDRAESAPGFETAVEVERTRVRFSRLSAPEIDFLIERGDPLDKAGAYAIQAQAALFVEEIRGDYWNIVGLPVSLVYRMIGSFNLLE